MKAVIVVRPNSTLSAVEVRRHCREVLESHLVPKFVELVAELPRTASGKLTRRGLVEDTE